MLSRILIFLIGIYKIVFSFKRPCCRFIPTCSSYAIEAIKKHGAYKGSILAFKRIMRCRPGKEFGYDPVPDIIHKKGKKEYVE